LTDQKQPTSKREKWKKEESLIKHRVTKAFSLWFLKASSEMHRASPSVDTPMVNPIAAAYGAHHYYC
jgi:hypothetical protein